MPGAAARASGAPAPRPPRPPQPRAAGAERWLNPAEMSAWLAFLEVSHLLERAIEQQLRQDAGLSHAQYEILSRLEAAEGGQVRMSDLAEGIVVSRSGLTYQVTQLEKAGLVRREKCPSDDRGVLAVLTSEGRSALARAAPGHLRVVRENLIDVLSPAQLATLADALDRGPGPPPRHPLTAHPGGGQAHLALIRRARIPINRTQTVHVECRVGGHPIVESGVARVTYGA